MTHFFLYSPFNKKGNIQETFFPLNLPIILKYLTNPLIIKVKIELG